MPNISESGEKVPWLKAASAYVPKVPIEQPTYPAPVSYEKLFVTLSAAFNGHNIMSSNNNVHYKEECIDCTTCQESCKLMLPIEDILQIDSSVYGRRGAPTRAHAEEKRLNKRYEDEDLKINPSCEVSGW
jgi:hypothetical protein